MWSHAQDGLHEAQEASQEPTRAGEEGVESDLRRFNLKPGGLGWVKGREGLLEHEYGFDLCGFGYWSELCILRNLREGWNHIFTLGALCEIDAHLQNLSGI